MYITISQLVEMGVMPQEIEAKISGGAWKTARLDPIEDGERRILLSSLPLELQTKWDRANRISPSSPEILSLLAEAENFGLADRETRITELLSLLAADERAAFGLATCNSIPNACTKSHTQPAIEQISITTRSGSRSTIRSCSPCGVVAAIAKLCPPVSAS